MANPKQTPKYVRCYFCEGEKQVYERLCPVCQGKGELLNSSQRAHCRTAVTVLILTKEEQTSNLQA